MILVTLATLGLVVLVAVGVYQLWAGRLTALAPGDQLLVADVAYLTRADLRRPRRLLARRKLANLLIALCELVVLIVAGVAAVALLTTTAVAPPYAAAVGAAYLVGAYLVGRALYVRLGFPTPVGDAGDPDDVAAALRAAGDDAVATAYRSLREADATARGDGVDDVTAALLAGARTGAARDDLARWAAEAGVASEATVHRRATELTDGGLLTDDDVLAFDADRLADGDPADVVAVATSLDP